MGRRELLLIALVSLGCSQPLAPPVEERLGGVPKLIGLSKHLDDLTAQQNLVMRLHSQGCYHNYKAQLHFTSVAGTVQVSGEVWDGINGAVVARREVVVPRALSDKETRALDEELVELRNAPREGFCTTTTTYDLTWQDANGATRAEHIENSTCALARKYYFGPDSARGYPALSFTMLAGEALHRRYAVK